jgi:hypothetical protein
MESIILQTVSNVKVLVLVIYNNICLAENASRQCLMNGTWDNITDYKECSKHDIDVSTDISLIIYAVGKFEF